VLIDGYIDDKTFDEDGDLEGNFSTLEKLSFQLATRSFCTMANGSCTGDALSAIHKEIADMGVEFQNLPTTIREGLLGDRGSSESYELAEQYGFEDTDNLHRLCSRMAAVSGALAPFVEEFGICYKQRTNFELLRSGNPSNKQGNPLTRDVAAKWASLFSAQKVMILCFLGPGDGKLQLRPHYSTFAQPLLVKLSPGMIVMVRTDLLECVLTCEKKSLTLCSVNLSPANVSPIGSSTPPTREILQWIFEYVKEYKHKQPEEIDIFDEDLPRQWQTMMNHNYFAGDACIVAGQAARVPAAPDSATWLSAAMQATDVIERIPYSRWSHEIGRAHV